MKQWRFHEKVDISWKSQDFIQSKDFMKKWNFMNKSIFHEKVEISWKSWDSMKRYRFNEKLYISHKGIVFIKSLDFMKRTDSMKKSGFHEKVETSWRVEISSKQKFNYARGGRLFSTIQSGPVHARVGEGSTCPSRGKLWLTVYRAHASLWVQLTWEQFFTPG